MNEKEGQNWGRGREGGWVGGEDMKGGKNHFEDCSFLEAEHH